MGQVRPVAVLALNIVGVLADDSDLLHTLEGQHAVVLQHRDGAARGAQGGLTMLLAADAAGHALLLRLAEEVHAELDGQDVAHGLVQHGFVHFALANGLDGGLVEAQGGHHHVVAGRGGLNGCVLNVLGGELLGHQALAVVPVGDDEAVEAHFFAEDGLHSFGVGGEGVAVDGAVGRHEGGAACVHRAMEGRHEDLLHLAVGHLGVHRVAGAHGLAVADVVLCAGENGVRRIQAFTLVALDDAVGHFAGQVGVLAEGLVDAAPAGIAAQAAHGGEGPVQAVGGYLASRHAAHFLRHGRVPGAGCGQLGGEDGRVLIEAVAVDGVDAENNRDAQAALMQGGLLHLAGVVAQHVQEGARAQLRPAQGFLAAHHGVGHLHHLSGLFLQGHLRQQGFDLLADGFVGHEYTSS